MITVIVFIINMVWLLVMLTVQLFNDLANSFWVA